MSKSYTLAIFVNEERGIFHIWTTTQTEMNNVSVSNAFSKSRSALNGKDSSQSAATTSFFRVIASTEPKEWNVEHVKLGEVPNDEVKSEYEHWFNLLVEMGYECVSRDPKVRLRSGRYAGSKFKARKITNMTYAQVKEYAENMLKDCFVEDEIILPESKKIANSVLAVDSEVENVSQMWSYVFHSYVEDMKKAA
jgi:hypothetical protein